MITKGGDIVARETGEGIFEALGLKFPEPSTREIVEGKPIEPL